MGVVIGARVYELELPKLPEYADVSVTAQGLTVGEALEYMEFMDGLYIAPVMSAEQVEKRDSTYRMFATRVIEWNLEMSKGVPLSKDLDGMRKLDWRMAKDLIGAWVRAVSDVPAPLDKQSSNGEKSPVESTIPMEPWLESPGSLPEPVQS